MIDAEKKPLLLQNDFTIWLEANHPDFEAVRQHLNQFADLVKSPSYIHTYKMSALSLWNAAAMGIRLGEILAFLNECSKWGIPSKIRNQIEIWMNRYGCLRLEVCEENLRLHSLQENILVDLFAYPSLNQHITHWINPNMVEIDPASRGIVKQELIKLGYPVEDCAGYHRGESFHLDLLKTLANGSPFELRPYQWDAVNAFYREDRGESKGSGVLVLPCGAGKTVIGIAIMERLLCATLILTSNVTSVKQWKNELLQKTNISVAQIGEYSGKYKEVCPITIATYQILTHRNTKNELFNHMELFQKRDWGLIIYDEVHLLPAPVFRATADIQATRRLGLTATLIREDGHETDVFSLIGPKRHEVPWKQLEGQGWIAKAICTEVLVRMPALERAHYEAVEPKHKFRIAGENSLKHDMVKMILAKHPWDSILIIGQYLDQLEALSKLIVAPIINGLTPYNERERLYGLFKAGVIKQLIVSKVANFAVDLPDAAVAIQISGSYGSRQEEAQRLGRIMRAKSGDNAAYFYTLVSQDTNEQQFAQKRQLFLIEQGYQYLQLEAELFETEGHMR
ncbi:MAG: helicase [Bacilli bacterium]|nr:helicase [Bacilli bacterium]